MSFDKAQRLLDAAKAKGYLDTGVLVAFGIGLGVGGLTLYQTVFPTKTDSKVEASQTQTRLDEMAAELKRLSKMAESKEPAMPDPYVGRRKVAQADLPKEIVDFPEPAPRPWTKDVLDTGSTYSGPTAMSSTARQLRRHNP